MKKQQLFSLLIIALCTVIIQGCTYERMDPPCPSITSLVPSAAGFDDTVVINGSDFLTGMPTLYTINVGSKIVTPLDVPNSTSLRFKVPKGLGDGPVSISVGGRTCSSGSGQNFTYEMTITEVKLFASGFNSPQGIDVDGNGNVILADKNNHVIKQITPAGQISIVAGKNGVPGTLDNDAGNFVNFNNPDDVAVDVSGNIYVADYFNHCIRKILSNAQHSVSTVVGTIGVSGDNDGSPTTSKLTFPRGVVINGANSVFAVEFTKNRLRNINFSNNSVVTLLGDGTTSALNFPIRVVYSEKRNAGFPILIADRNNSRILEANTNRTTNTPINLPFQPQDLAVDEAGNILVLNKTGRRVTLIYKNNTRQDIIGLGINYDLQNPSGLAIDIKNRIIYISDEGSNNIIMAKYE